MGVIKLRDLTEEQYQKWKKKNCDVVVCSQCPFYNFDCISTSCKCWINHKDLYSDKFLNQEIEIEEEIISQKEKEYLEFVLRPFKDKIKYIEKIDNFSQPLEHICCRMNDDDALSFPDFDAGTRYKGMELYKEYTLKELGLFKEEAKWQK